MGPVKKTGSGFLDIYRKIPDSVKASLWFLFANIFQKAVMVVFTPLFTRLMTAEEFSRYAVFQSWETILTVFATLNISNYATAKALVEQKDERDEFVSGAECLTVVLAVFTFGIFLLIRAVFSELRLFPGWVVFLMFVDIISVAFFAFWSQLERFNLRYKALTAVSIVSGVSSPLIAFILIALSERTGLYKGWSRTIGLVGTNGCIALFVCYICFKKSKKIFSVKYWRFCITYCLPLIPHFLSMAFLQKIGQLFVDYYCGAEMSGIYALASSLALLMMVFNDALTKTLVPWTYQKMAERKYKEINKPVILSLAVIAVLDITMAMAAPELVAIFADSSYSQAVYAVPPLVAVCFYGFLYNTFANIEYYFKETKFVSMASIVAGIVIIIANLILVPQFGFIAAAYATLLSYLIYAVMHYLFMKKTLDRHLEGRQIYNHVSIVKLSLCFTITIICIPVLYSFPVLRWGIIVMVCVIACVKRKRVIENILFLMRKDKEDV